MLILVWVLRRSALEWSLHRPCTTAERVVRAWRKDDDAAMSRGTEDFTDVGSQSDHIQISLTNQEVPRASSFCKHAILNRWKMAQQVQCRRQSRVPQCTTHAAKQCTHLWCSVRTAKWLDNSCWSFGGEVSEPLLDAGVEFPIMNGRPIVKWPEGLPVGAASWGVVGCDTVSWKEPRGGVTTVCLAEQDWSARARSLRWPHQDPLDGSTLRDLSEHGARVLVIRVWELNKRWSQCFVGFRRSCLRFMGGASYWVSRPPCSAPVVW